MHRIGLLGAECSGKSELAAALARTLPACVVPEELRAFVERTGRPPHQDEQSAILAAQVAAEEAVAAACPHRWLVADPAPLMTAVYSVAYFDDDTLLGDAIEHARGYADLLWCDIDLPWRPDGAQRDGPEYRQRVHDVIGRLVHDRLAPAGLRVRLLSGGPAARADAARRAWQPRGPIGPT